MPPIPIPASDRRIVFSSSATEKLILFSGIGFEASAIPLLQIHTYTGTGDSGRVNGSEPQVTEAEPQVQLPVDAGLLETSE